MAYLGMDFGTSGARATVIDDAGKVLFDVKQGYGSEPQKDWAGAWQRALHGLLSTIPSDLRSQVEGVAFDGTSATAMLVDRASGAVLAPPKLYNEAQAREDVEAAKAMAPPAHTASASTSTLAKLLAWNRLGVWQEAKTRGRDPCLLHQADWLASLLHGDRGTSDWNNSLKLGFDPEEERYPAWLAKQGFAHLMPAHVVAPGAAVAPVSHSAPASASAYLPGAATPPAAAPLLPPTCLVCAGTTDSIAAFVAAGVSLPGQAVTSLGSTLAVKLVSTKRVDDAAYGVYAHRLGDSWLVGGASNTGGAVLRKYFTDQQLAELTQRVDPDKPTGLDYYPLVSPGERFPVNDPVLVPRLEPRPADDAVFLQGIFEAIARIEGDAYALLHRLGASKVTEVHSAGGGAVNEKWTTIRSRAIGVPVLRSGNGEASYGAALLARQGVKARKGKKA